MEYFLIQKKKKKKTYINHFIHGITKRINLSKKDVRYGSI